MLREFSDSLYNFFTFMAQFCKNDMLHSVKLKKGDNYELWPQ
ncbi:hypothetical protein M899_1615 [Bacteriovorax sp. BSW11_IV]|nr:hypothetical protein M899_1615 [Bacteriovorax sp. BSW11_IV]